MTIPRMLVLLVGLAAIGIAVVAIRVEEARVLRRIQELQFEEAEAQRQIRAQEMTLWTLRAPPSIRERSTQLRPVTEPAPVRKSGESKTATKRR
ncbi:MAG TPA: hypothetical protein PL151_16275 [Phycisphaerae bacterium]|nr:hypothetical protein [Phycisphaerae bacterium]HOJ74650.1 hypothetical protein [Phycisphaerae bacterium]HOM50549.1 hypothetical protein [Phycisphaerae bacterium]HOQ84771.1 hypothetical protein [Phycisphaerae bacterium]HPP26267.1 hypothetical protein [Phycisphaerae bacterium]